MLTTVHAPHLSWVAVLWCFIVPCYFFASIFPSLGLSLVQLSSWEYHFQNKSVCCFFRAMHQASRLYITRGLIMVLYSHNFILQDSILDLRGPLRVLAVLVPLWILVIIFLFILLVSVNSDLRYLNSWTLSKLLFLTQRSCFALPILFLEVTSVYLVFSVFTRSLSRLAVHFTLSCILQSVSV